MESPRIFTLEDVDKIALNAKRDERAAIRKMVDKYDGEYGYEGEFIIPGILKLIDDRERT